MSNGPYLDPDRTSQLLAYALPDEEHDLCRKPEGRAACAIAAAGLAARRIESLVEDVSLFLTITERDMGIENDFSPTRLRAYLKALKDVLETLDHVADVVRTEPYKYLPSAGDIYRELLHMRDRLKDDAVDPIKAVLRSVNKDKTQVIEEAIYAVRTMVAWSVKSQWHKVVRRLNEAASGLSSDWQHGLREISKDPCCPQADASS